MYVRKIDPNNTAAFGGRKSHMIEECKRIHMGLEYTNWLPIAITFNHIRGVDDSDVVLI